MSKKIARPIHPTKSFIFEMYLIGYEKMGEGIIFFLKNDNRIIYSAVVDCYEENGLNKTIEILKKENVNVLNLICWTHPDLDHSVGLEKILTLRDEHTLIIVPEGIDNKLAPVYSKESQTVYNEISNIFIQRYENHKKTFPNVEFVQNVNDDIYEQYYYDKKVIKDIRIKTLSPISRIIKSRFLVGKTLSNMNEFSICLSLKIGDFDILLGGDTEDTTINNIVLSELYKVFDIIKIPHHGSSGSLALLNKIDKSKKVAVSCSTTYSSNGLPVEETVEKYLNCSEKLFCTQPFHDKYEEFGIIKIEADILNNIIDVEKLGNAKQISYDERLRKYINI